ncbi:hypothetical protein OIU76_013232, partial [Salix suchowensis]
MKSKMISIPDIKHGSAQNQASHHLSHQP